MKTYLIGKDGTAYASSLRLEWARRHERAILWMASAGLIGLAGTILLDHHVLGATIPLFWDMPVYDAALKALAAGRDPYDSAILQHFGAPPDLPFSSPPAITIAMTYVAKGPLLALFNQVLMAAHLLAICATPWILGRHFYGREPGELALAVGAFFMVFGAAGVSALGSGNYSTTFYWLIAATMANGVERGRWTSFHVAVLCAAIFKPFFATFWILPAFVQGFSARNAAIGAAGMLLAGATYVLAFLWMPTIFENWLHNLATFRGDDLGDNVFAAAGGVFDTGSAPWFPIAIQLLFDCALLEIILASPLSGRVRWALLLIAAVFMNPRALSFDEAFAAIPLTFAAATLLPGKLPQSLRLVLSTYGLAALSLIVTYRSINLVPRPFLFPVIVFAVIAWSGLSARRRPFTLAW